MLNAARYVESRSTFIPAPHHLFHIFTGHQRDILSQEGVQLRIRYNISGDKPARDSRARKLAAIKAGVLKGTPIKKPGSSVGVSAY
ncbi:hypothetical protein BOTBODRAFT_145400 [Botryobasidium botryosum FD-172 SS1]|uniref:Uncharacterized protein n=1 Tax=Botryobasidium botryosum (strain FD-172 SS1) TaxID=930990 RepID=A0A067MTF7_BOTB1|nr:hypothetical protein BOTBODRAFT_145400 [Botryobasidium botryosum FD-172 SS1]